MKKSNAVFWLQKMIHEKQEEVKHVDARRAAIGTERQTAGGRPLSDQEVASQEAYYAAQRALTLSEMEALEIASENLCKR